MYYSTADAAIALGIERKTLDNLLVGAARTLVSTGRQGVERKIDQHVLERLAVALLLRRDLGVPLGTGIGLSVKLLDADNHRVAIGSLGAIDFDVSRLRLVLRQALADAVQDRAPVRRGRPRRTSKEKRGAL